MKMITRRIFNSYLSALPFLGVVPKLDISNNKSPTGAFYIVMQLDGQIPNPISTYDKIVDIFMKNTVEKFYHGRDLTLEECDILNATCNNERISAKCFIKHHVCFNSDRHKYPENYATIHWFIGQDHPSNYSEFNKRALRMSVHLAKYVDQVTFRLWSQKEIDKILNTEPKHEKNLV